MAAPAGGKRSTEGKRLARYFRRRLWRAARKIAIDRAVEMGILHRHPGQVDDGSIPILRPDVSLAKLSAADVSRILRRGVGPEPLDRCRASSDENVELLEDAGPVTEPAKGIADGDQEEARPTGANAAARDFQVSPDDTKLALGKIFAAADPLRASDVATLLLVVQGIAKANLSVDALLSVLRLDQPIIVINSPVAGFEESLLGLLESGIVLPRLVGLADGYGLGRRRFPLPHKLQIEGSAALERHPLRRKRLRQRRRGAAGRLCRADDAAHHRGERILGLPAAKPPPCRASASRLRPAHAGGGGGNSEGRARRAPFSQHCLRSTAPFSLSAIWPWPFAAGTRPIAPSKSFGDMPRPLPAKPRAQRIPTRPETAQSGSASRTAASLDEEATSRAAARFSSRPC